MERDPGICSSEDGTAYVCFTGSLAKGNYRGGCIAAKGGEVGGGPREEPERVRNFLLGKVFCVNIVHLKQNPTRSFVESVCCCGGFWSVGYFFANMDFRSLILQAQNSSWKLKEIELSLLVWRGQLSFQYYVQACQIMAI